MGAMAAILIYDWDNFNRILLIYKSPYFLQSFESTGLLVQKFKTAFQDGGNLGSPTKTIFDLQVTSYQVSESIGLSVQKFKLDFQDGCHLGVLTGTILAILDL